jgi:nucleoside-diphosphate-sugar epimerase
MMTSYSLVLFKKYKSLINKQMKTDKTLILDNIETRDDFYDIDDIIEFFRHFMESTYPNYRYDIYHKMNEKIKIIIYNPNI